MTFSHHIMIAEDHPAVRTVLARLVSQFCPDAIVVEAAHGAEALSALAHHQPNLIITDYYMPVMGGLELVRTLRAQGAGMPIVVLSSDDSIAETILLHGATAFLPKPFELRAFKQVLHQLLFSGNETSAIGQ